MVSSSYSFEFRILQFPTKLSFAMTINKAQGQTLKVVGINLEVCCFANGQLYVGYSRVTSEENVIILAEDGRTKNIVYKEVLSKDHS